MPIGGLLMPQKPTYEELEQRIKELEKENVERRRAEKELHVASDNLLNILASMEDGVYIVNQECDIQYVNPVLKKEFGPIDKRKCYEYFHDREEVCPWCKNPEVFAGKTVRWEWYSFKNQRTYDLIDTPLKNPDGSLSKLEIFRDITEMKQAAERIKQQAKFLKLVIDSIASPFYVIDVHDYSIKLANSVGQKDKILIGQTCYSFTHNRNKPCDSSDCSCPVKIIKKNKLPVIVEHLHYDKEGNPRNIEIHATPVFDGEGNVAEVIEYCLDVTNRKRAEEALQQSEQKYRNLFESSIDPIYVSTQEGPFIDVNQSFLDFFGYNMEDIQDLKAQAIYVNPDDRLIFQKDIERKKYVKDYELKLRKKDGTKVDCLVSATERQTGDGSLVGYQGIVRDVTEKKRMENALTKSHERSRHLSSQLIEAQERERKRISLELHDEMGQALASIGINLGTIDKNLPSDCPPIIKDKLAEIDFMIEQTSERVRKLSLHLRPPILDDLGLIPTLRWLLSGLESSIKVEFDYNQIDDKDRLSQEIETVIYRVVQEATTNILKHAEAKEVVVNLNIEEGISLIVKDDGKGFDAKDQKVTDDLKAGIGILGMNERVEILGGKFDIQSRKGYGTRISVEIPLY
jgi:PAS domain S-box-containing protein